MYRIIRMGLQFIAYDIGSVEDDLDNIEAFLIQGNAVILAEDLDIAAELLGINPSEINIVE